MVNFDAKKCPFILSRDNMGFTLINVKSYKVYQLAKRPISANLYGHGDILRVMQGADNSARIITVV